MLYPSREVSEKLLKTKKVACWVYNNLLKTGMQSKYEMNYALTEMKEQHPWLREYYAQMLQTISTKIAGAKKGLEVLNEHMLTRQVSCIQSNMKNTIHSPIYRGWIQN
jgi:hypothetical protein